MLYVGLRLRLIRPTVKMNRGILIGPAVIDAVKTIHVSPANRLTTISSFPRSSTTFTAT